MALLRLEAKRPEEAAVISALPWVRDGIDPSELKSTLSLELLALDSPDVFQALSRKSWLLDGLNPEETIVIYSMHGISGESFVKRDLAMALQIAGMPFMETIDGFDAAAVQSLGRLFEDSDRENDYFHYVLSHPTLQDGITDDQTMVVAVLGLVVRHRPELLETLLEGVVVERRVVQLPLSGEVTLSVINIRPGTYRSMDILERTVRFQEEFMSVPFPRRHVGLLVADVGPGSGGGGPGGLITVDPGLEEDNYIISHEVAHTYWAFFPSWIAEGGADFIAKLPEGPQSSSAGCSLSDNLFELDSLYQELADKGESTRIILASGCPYTMGRGLFYDLYDTLGDESFRRAFGRLYQAMRDEEHDDDCTGPTQGLCYVTTAFVIDALPASAALAEPVIDRWYYGRPWKERHQGPARRIAAQVVDTPGGTTPTLTLPSAKGWRLPIPC